MQNLGIVTGAFGLDICPPTHVIFIVIRRSNAFSTEYQLLMCAFQYIKQNLEINSFHKSDFTSHITLKGWRVHLEKPYPSCMGKPYHNHFEDNFQRYKMVVLSS